MLVYGGCKETMFTSSSDEQYIWSIDFVNRKVNQIPVSIFNGKIFVVKDIGEIIINNNKLGPCKV